MPYTHSHTLRNKMLQLADEWMNEFVNRYSCELSKMFIYIIL